MLLQKIRVALFAILMGLVSFATAALSAESDFFSGKTITLYVGFSPGGGVVARRALLPDILRDSSPVTPTS